MGEVDTQVYFAFGTFHTEQLTKGQKIEGLTHEYLNLFRFPSLLRRIYEEKRWETLVHNLILKSNYDARILFNQRLRDYSKKTLFKIINENTVTEYSWEKSAGIIKKYRQAFYSMMNREE